MYYCDEGDDDDDTAVRGVMTIVAGTATRGQWMPSNGE